MRHAYRWACRSELEALKPGNVGLHGRGHGMVAGDFLRSAEVSASPITDTRYALGQRIYHAVRSTRQAVGCNTNLGIVLLCAPLLKAAQHTAPRVGLREALAGVLMGADRVDAQWVYRAIRLACPAGLGESESNDVRDDPEVSLAEAMCLAQDRDRIARQYADTYRDIFDYAVPRLIEYEARWGSVSWATTGIYLDLLGFFPDTHIVRKSGGAQAEWVRVKAAQLAVVLCRCRDPQSLAQSLYAFDAELKSAGINPGTTADLAVATLLVAQLEGLVNLSLAT